MSARCTLAETWSFANALPSPPNQLLFAWRCTLSSRQCYIDLSFETFTLWGILVLPLVHQANRQPPTNCHCTQSHSHTRTGAQQRTAQEKHCPPLRSPSTAAPVQSLSSSFCSSAFLSFSYAHSFCLRESTTAGFERASGLNRIMKRVR